jgi:GntR family transcriptional repressor for pyruvate dehydrogenase complex
MPDGRTRRRPKPRGVLAAAQAERAISRNGPPRGAGELFRRISVGRISEMIVEQIRLLIRQGQLRPGDRLPAERELCERFGVSRVTVREALRVLESNGLVQIRVGARGGAFVTAPSSDRVGEGLADLISLSALGPAEVTEARLILELGLVPLVCERATERDIEDLREICARAQASAEQHFGIYSMEMSAEFHFRTAVASHNAAVQMLAETFRRPLLRSLEVAHDLAPDMGRVGQGEHLAFIDAVEARDADTASRIMSAHLGRTAQRVLAAGGPKGPGLDVRSGLRSLA